MRKLRKTLRIRNPMESFSKDKRVPRWANIVTTALAQHRRNNGIFSMISVDHVLGRLSGQTSNSKRTNGTVTSVGLHKRPAVKLTKTTRYLAIDGPRA